MGPIQAELALLVLATARTGGMMIVAPLPWRRAPAKVRAALALILAVVAHGGTAPPPGDFGSLAEASLAVPSELLVGAAIGLVVRLSFAVVEIAGEMISPLFGLAAAAVFDPGMQATSTPLTKILVLLIGLLAVSAGVHRAVLGALLEGYRILPPGHVADSNLAVPMLVKLSSMALEVGVQVALPVLGMLLLTQVALAFVSRAAPTMQIFSIGFTVSTMVGGLSLLLALPDMGRMMLRDLLQVGSRIDALYYVLTR
jgi:flagellar biosynthetic protein FliR